MNDQLKEMANTALATMIQDALTVREFAEEQIPLVVQELLRWEFTVSLIAWIVGVLLMVVPAAMWLRAWRRKEVKTHADGSLVSDHNHTHGIWDGYFLLLIPVVVSIIIGVTVVINSFTWLQIAMAPRVFLLEYAANLM